MKTGTLNLKNLSTNHHYSKLKGMGAQIQGEEGGTTEFHRLEKEFKALNLAQK